jgi:Flp pilus assembly protein TadD
MLGRYAEAVGAYEGVIAAASDWWEAHANLGICHARNGDLEKAEVAFRHGLEDCPGSPEIRDELAAHLLALRKNLPEALRLSEEAVALGRDEIRHLITLGEARLALGDEAGAAEAYDAVLALDPENPEAHLELGILNERKGQMERAEEHFVESLKVDPANPRALYSYASLYYTADDLEVAEEILERAIAADARYSPALSALASIQARRGEYGERDVEHFRSALEFAPLHADPRFRTLLSRMVGDRSNGQT